MLPSGLVIRLTLTEGWMNPPGRWLSGQRSLPISKGTTCLCLCIRTRAKILWDDQYLYIGAELEEPHIWATYTQNESVIFHENNFEIFIDPSGDTHNYYELEINALGTRWDLLLTRPYRNGGLPITAWDIAGLKTGIHLAGTINQPADTDTLWSVEIALPWTHPEGDCSGEADSSAGRSMEGQLLEGSVATRCGGR
jgi:hypothetical protein